MIGKRLAAGTDDYISKPFAAEKLVDVVQRWAIHQAPRQETEIAPTSDGKTASTLPVGREPICIRISQELADLIPAYLSNRRDDIVALSAALENNDVDLIRTIGHGMKGSGGGYGFSRISEIGRDLERAANETNSREIQSLTHALAEYIERLEVVYK